jgi:hypothetical protein
VAKKRTKAVKARKAEVPEQVIPDAESSTTAVIVDPEEQIGLLIAKGKKKGFLTYEEMNDDLPGEAVSVSRLDNLLATLDEMGITLLDEADVKARKIAKSQRMSLKRRTNRPMAKDRKKTRRSAMRTYCSKSNWSAKMSPGESTTQFACT